MESKVMVILALGATALGVGIVRGPLARRSDAYTNTLPLERDSGALRSIGLLDRLAALLLIAGPLVLSYYSTGSLLTRVLEVSRFWGTAIVAAALAVALKVQWKKLTGRPWDISEQPVGTASLWFLFGCTVFLMIDLFVGSGFVFSELFG